MVLLEAFALKRPVIASRVGGIPEVVSHGESGILVNPAKPDELARAIGALIDDQVTAVAFGVAGRARIEADFSASTMANQTAGMYRSVCKG